MKHRVRAATNPAQIPGAAARVEVELATAEVTIDGRLSPEQAGAALCYRMYEASLAAMV